MFSSVSGVSAAFVSRTGKTTDVTQIKGWRAKFTLSETPPTPSACRPEGAFLRHVLTAGYSFVVFQLGSGRAGPCAGLTGLC